MRGRTAFSSQFEIEMVEYFSNIGANFETSELSAKGFFRKDIQLIFYKFPKRVFEKVLLVMMTVTRTLSCSTSGLYGLYFYLGGRP